MKKKKRLFIVLFVVVLLGACVGDNDSSEFHEALGETVLNESDEVDGTNGLDSSGLGEEQDSPSQTTPRAVYDQRELESILSEFATDVVIARYVGHRPFGELIEYEFSVSEVVVGAAAETIFVYFAPGVDVGFLEADEEEELRAGELPFYPGVEYLLPLIRIDSAYTITHEDGFVFIREIIIDLDRPSNSTMFGMPLAQHSSLELDGELSREEIIAHVYELTKDNVGRIPTIRSDALEEIVHGSPYLLLVEIGAPRRLAQAQVMTDWGATDLYYVTVVESLKGEMEEGFQMVMMFHADTVFPGERHIVASRPVVDGYHWHEFTSRYSLLQVEQFDEIMLILNEN